MIAFLHDPFQHPKIGIHLLEEPGLSHFLSPIWPCCQASPSHHLWPSGMLRLRSRAANLSSPSSAPTQETRASMFN